MGVPVVNGFTGSSIWHMLYAFPPVSQEDINEGFRYFAEMWKPILAEFKRNKVRFALEVHPTEIAFDLYTAGARAGGDRRRPEFRLQLRSLAPVLAGGGPGEVPAAVSATASATCT